MDAVQLSQHIVGLPLVVVCVVMVIAAAAIYWSTALGSPWTVPRAATRAVLQLAAVAAILTAALRNLGTSVGVLAVMFVAAAVTAARRSRSNRSWLLAAALGTGMTAVLPPLLLASGWCRSRASPGAHRRNPSGKYHDRGLGGRTPCTGYPRHTRR